VALEHRGFRLLFLSSVVSGMGGQLQQVSNMWQIYALTGSALHLGLTGLARAVPIICFSLAGGVIADRVDRKKIIVTTQAANGMVAIALGMLSATGHIEVWHIYAAVFLNATLMSVSAPARRALIANLVPREHLVNAMALNTSLHQIDRIIAPAIAGVLIALFGLSVTYTSNGVAHFVTAGFLILIPLGPAPLRPRGSPLRNLLDGLSFVQARSIILVLLATDAAAMLFGSYQVLLPIIADQTGAGAAGFGTLVSAPAAGGLIGALAIMYLGDFPFKGRFIVGSILAYCCCLIALAVTPWFALALVVAVGLGLTDSMQAAPRNAIIQLMTPDELRGRVSSFQHMLVTGMPALGHGLMGGAAGAIGGPIALIAGAVICACINLGILVGRPDLRARDLGSQAEGETISGRELAASGSHPSLAGRGPGAGSTPS
jgi:MFS family permease